MAGWVSVKEKLPENSVLVLVMSSSGQHVAWISEIIKGHVFWQYSDCCGCFADSVTHWMPLPEPPNV